MSNKRLHRAATFDRLYKADPDPWDFLTSTYEREKRKETLSALGGRTFDRGLEVGCATGVLTAELATHCRTLLAVDVSEIAIEIARHRLAGLAHVNTQIAHIPEQWPSGKYDLIVLSEVLYFLQPTEVAKVAAYAMSELETGGICLLVNWIGPSDTELSGNQAAELFRNSDGWKSNQHQSFDLYRIDVLAK